jgi:hypothetical protein
MKPEGASLSARGARLLAAEAARQRHADAATALACEPESTVFGQGRPRFINPRDSPLPNREPQGDFGQPLSPR